MKARKSGWIVNISSPAGLHPKQPYAPGVRGGTVYGMCKAALERFTTGLASEVYDDGIAVNVVSPGLVDTPWTAEWQDLHQAIKLMAPMGRAAVPEDVAEVVQTLVDSTYVTGQVWVIDGGLGLR